MAAIRISFAGCSMASPPRGWPRIRISGSCSSILPTRNTIPDALGILSGVEPLPFERDVELATLLLEAIPREPRLGVANRRAGSDVELPHVLQAGQDGSVVNPLLERDGFVGAQRLIRDERLPGVDDEDIDSVDRERLHPVRRDFVRSTHPFPRWTRPPDVRCRRATLGALLLADDLVRSGLAGIVAEALDGVTADDVRGEDFVQIRLPDAILTSHIIGGNPDDERGEDFVQIRLPDARIPDVVGI